MLRRIVTVGWGVVIVYFALAALVPHSLPFRLILGPLIVPAMFLLAPLTIIVIILAIYSAGTHKRGSNGRKRRSPSGE
jgi:multisubunit Na+/H+ antiporter MnhG subunit